MGLLLWGIGLILLGGLLSFALSRQHAVASAVAVTGITAGSVIGLIPTLRALVGGVVDSLQVAWSVPSGSLSFAIDPLSALFLLVIFLLAIPVSLYGASYLAHHREAHNIGATWFFTSALVASMAIVVIARNAVLFLVAWEVMSVASYFLVTLEHGQRAVRRAGMIYLIAAHIGAAFLIAFFLVLGRHTGSLDFEALAAGTGPTGMLFLLALIGFGSKAGLVPFHVWLPEAHPAAPSHISALMSGVMIKMGIYGIVRAILLLGGPAYWWGVLLIAVGLASALLGVLHALLQSNIKRLLAFSSVENVGISTIGLGIGTLGWASHSTTIALLGFAGALLHVINHALFKGSLFLAAGSILQRCGALELDRLGGLQRRMPRTATVVIVASIAIAGLPLGNGFVSEFLIYLGALRTALLPHTDLAAIAIAVVIGMAMVGGLAAICFAKLIGIGLLGAPRTAAAANARESSGLMTAPMLIMAALCVVIALNAYALPRVFIPLAGSLMSVPSSETAEVTLATSRLLAMLSIGTAALAALIVILALIRRLILRARSVRIQGTWDCGYIAPTARMQYSGFSFVQITAALFRRLVPFQRRTVPPAGPFPRGSSFAIRTHDGFLYNIYEPTFRGVGWALGRLRVLQHGNVQLYILYILIATLALLFWGLR